MSQNSTRKGRSSQPALTLARLFLLFVILLSSACRPEAPAPATQAPDTPSQKIPTTNTPVGFEVVDSGQPIPPAVIERRPAGGKELPLDGEITLIFDQPMDEARTADALRLTDTEGKRVPGSVVWPTPTTLSFRPKEPLQHASVYFASLSDDASSLKGVPIQEPVAFEFHTIGNLEVSQTFPAKDTPDVAVDSVVTVIFNRPVAPLVVAEDQSSLPDPLVFSPELEGKGEWINTSVYAFRPSKAMASATKYTVTVPAGLADAAGETQLVEGFSWQFTTSAPGVGPVELSNGYFDPPQGYNKVRLDQGFALSFYQPMDPASTEAALSIASSNGEQVPLTYSWNEDFTRVVFTPTQQMALGTEHVLSVDTSALAADGGNLAKGLSWNFVTDPYPYILSVYPGDGAVQTTFEDTFRIEFASPMNIESVKKHIQISPERRDNSGSWYDEWGNSMNLYGFQPSTQYTVRLEAGMEDIYGNPIQESRTIRFTTGPYAPSANLQMPYLPAIFRTGDAPQAQQFYVRYININSLELKLYQLSPEKMIDVLEGRPSQYEYRPEASSLVWQQTDRSSGARDEQVLKSYRPTNADGSPLPPGFYFLTLNASPVTTYGPYLDTRLIIVSNANLTFKSTATDALLWLTELDNGKPVSGASIAVFDEGSSPDNPGAKDSGSTTNTPSQGAQQIAGGSTDADGMLYLEGLPVPPEPYVTRYALTDGSDGIFAFVSSDWGSGANMYDYGLWNAYYSPSNRPSVYLYSDRPVYRPGQPVYYKGVVRMDDDLDYRLPEQSQVIVSIESYQEQVYTTTLQLSPFGTFSDKFLLDADATLGSYSISVRFPGEDSAVGWLGFSVAEYRKPEYQVTTQITPEQVLAGDNFTVDLKAEYYSGGGVGGADVAWTLSAEPFTFVPPGDDYSGFSFSDYELDAWDQSYFQGGYSQVIADGKEVTRDDGTLQLTLPADLSDTERSMRLTFEASVTDIAGSSVSSRATLTAHRSEVYPGVRPASYIGVAGEEQAFDLVAVDWGGKPQPGQKVDVEIVERRWYSVQEQDANGRIQWSSSVEDIPVANFSGIELDSKGEGQVRFTPPNGGIFRARVTARDAAGNIGRASAYLWVSGEDFIPWRQTNDRSFDIVADRDSYEPGDTAEILIASPFQGEATALVTVERGHIRYRDVVTLDSNSTIYPLPISADMAPNVYVSVLVVKGVDETNPSPNFKLGMLELKVDTRQQELVVEVTPDRNEVGPGEQVSYHVRTTDMDGNPVQAEVSLALTDLASLSLMSPNSAPILDYFYSYRTLSVWTSVPIGLDIEDYNASIEEHLAEGQGMGSGGGKGVDELGVLDVREEFPDTAYWEAHLVTNSDGEADVSVTLPDNLTTWRMDARAVTEDTRVGQTTVDVVATKPLLVRPQTPRFFVTGDETRLGTAVHNNTDQALSVTVSLTAEGLQLNGDETQSVDIPAKQQAYVTWDATVDRVSSDGTPTERVDLIFRAQGTGADGSQYSDASRPVVATLEGQGLPVYRYEAPESVGTSGMLLKGGQQVEAIRLPDWMNVQDGSLTIQVAPSLAAGMTEGLKYLESYPYECIEQTISKFLPNVISYRALQSAGLADPDLQANLDAEVSKSLQRIYNRQNGDGGWGWWGAQKSDRQTSAYVVLGLIEAKEAGYGVNPDVLERGLDYLRGHLPPLQGTGSRDTLNLHAFMLYVLARAGSPNVSRTVQLYDSRQDMLIYGRAFLAQALYLINPQDERLPGLLADFNSSAITSASGTHWEEEHQDPWGWNTNTRTTAIVLSVLSQIDPLNPINANAVRWLMAHRTEGRWNTTQETAWTLMALTDWMEASGELQAYYAYGVALNGEQIADGVAQQDTLRETLQLQVDVADLFKDQTNRLAFARNDGPGNMYYTAFLNVSLPVDQIEPLDQGIVVSRSYYNLQDDSTPISSANWGDLVLVRLTVVAPHDLYNVVVDDPLPAGLEAVDQSLETNPQAYQPQNYNWDDLYYHGWGWWTFDHIEMRDEKLVLSAQFLPAGTYTYSYVARAATPGMYQVIPPTAQEFYFPDVYGRGQGSLFAVNPAVTP